MSELAVARFEPVVLEVTSCAPTEYGKRWLDDRAQAAERFSSTIKDVVKLAIAEVKEWPWIQRKLDEEGVPQNISSGINQYAMPKLIDHLNAKTAFTIPALFTMGLWTVAPTSTSTGTLASEAAYTGYGRQTVAGANMNAATAATPSAATNIAAITFGNCTAGTSTLLGFQMCDSATIGAGNALWYGTLSSTVISTTQTPPTIAAATLNLSMTGT